MNGCETRYPCRRFQADNGPLGRRTVRAAELDCGQCEGCKGTTECSRWYLHKFRATYTTTLLRNGVDARTVMAFTGHEDLATVSTLFSARGRSTYASQDKQDCLGITSSSPPLGTLAPDVAETMGMLSNAPSVVDLISSSGRTRTYNPSINSRRRCAGAH